MRRPFLPFPLIALALGLLFLSGGSSAGEGDGASGARVEFDPAGVYDGAAVPVRVLTERPLRGAFGTAGGETFPLAPLADGSWVALAAIPLGFSEPAFPLDLTLLPADGPPEAGDSRLRVELPLAPRERKEQKLALPKEMVDYPPGVPERIEEENARVRGKLAGRAGEFPRRGFIRPTAGRVSGEFGNARVLNGQARSPHSGVDIAAPTGQAVVAANDARVALGGTFYLTGKTLLLDHGAGVFTLYAHLNKIKVNVGDRVRRGDRIGTVGATGRATGPHLHYGAVVRGVKVNPDSLDALGPLLEGKGESAPAT